MPLPLAQQPLGVQNIVRDYRAMPAGDPQRMALYNMMAEYQMRQQAQAAARRQAEAAAAMSARVDYTPPTWKGSGKKKKKRTDYESGIADEIRGRRQSLDRVLGWMSGLSQ